MAGPQKMGAYIKAAFTHRWNLLAFIGAAAAGAMSPAPDVVLPLVFAAEMLFLGLVATNPRFHRAVDAEQGAARAAEGAEVMRARFDELYRGLDPLLRKRFEELRVRCGVLAELAGKDPGSLGMDQVAQSQLGGVNKLLWVYLKLLHTKMTLERFFASIDTDELDRVEREAQRRLEELPKEPGHELAEKKRKSIEDTLTTVLARRANIKRAHENHEFVTLELERIGAKLSGISELAVNRQDPGLLTHDVDDVARSVEATEEAISELQVYSGLTAADFAAPEILSAPPQQVRVR